MCEEETGIILIYVDDILIMARAIQASYSTDTLFKTWARTKQSGRSGECR